MLRIIWEALDLLTKTRAKTLIEILMSTCKSFNGHQCSISNTFSTISKKNKLKECQSLGTKSQTMLAY